MDALPIVALRAEKLLKATSPENGEINRLPVVKDVMVQDGVVTEFVTAIVPPTLIVVPAFPILIVPAFTFPIPKVVPGTYTSTVGVVKLIYTYIIKNHNLRFRTSLNKNMVSIDKGMHGTSGSTNKGGAEPWFCLRFPTKFTFST
jgi:hypothetical protein